MPNAIKVMGDAFQDELQKIAAEKKAGKVLPVLVAGGVGWEALRRANEDRKLGRQIRKQQSPGLLG